ncbi:MAG: glycoside hydrolase family 2 TIM barrel-domain containing protein [Clostridia bacterium]
MTALPKPEFPRPERQRSQWLNLNGEWDFALFPIGEEASETAFAQTRTSYDRKITVPFSWASPLSGVCENKAGVGWYRRFVHFEAMARVFLCFGAVDYLCDVYVNGAWLCRHQGGYEAFECDATPLWHAGENLLEVRAEDNRGEAQLYGKQGYGEAQGIWQTVWLESRPQSYLGHFCIQTLCDGSITITAQAIAPDGARLVAAFDGQTWQAPIREGAAKLCFALSHPRLWSPDSPFLYEGTLTLQSGNDCDEVHTYFGIREISTAKVQGRSYRWITLNGEPIYLNGTLDQAFYPEGYFTAPDEAAIQDEAWRLKRLGLNMVRIHIKAEEPRKLYWMDKLGLLVMADIPCFWGEPTAQARAGYELEWPELIRRDLNHPCIFAWILFNETWGLFTQQDGERRYLPQTQAWVADVYRRAKQMDPTRLVEDNSACHYDHVQTDLYTWHFYLNGPEIVRDHIREVVAKSEVGSSFHCADGFVQTDAPLMNSECGMVWGVDESAGDSDLAWQYHYMLNEYRLHEKLCGFIFTEFHDVVNEFNGYYRINSADKDFGYEGFCRGMTLKDLHSADFLAVDCLPCQTLAGGATVEIPLVLSSFDNRHHKAGLLLHWELWHEGMDGRITDALGSERIPPFAYGTTALPALKLTLPTEPALAVLSLYLNTADGETISRNFTTFDVQAPLPAHCVETPVTQCECHGFSPVWTAQSKQKLCLGGEGTVCYQISLPPMARVDSLQLLLEASSKRLLRKDLGDNATSADLGFMRGHLVDRGEFINSYWMTDEERLPTTLEVLVNEVCIATLNLSNDWADSRGVLSWHYQPNPRRLDEAGSYGELCQVRIPSRMIPALVREGSFRLALRVRGNGLALYGRNSGRYPFGLLLKAEGES